jgi:chromosome segregation ATPase
MKVFIDALDEKIREKKSLKMKDFRKNSGNIEELEEENKKIKKKIESVQKEIEDFSAPSNATDEYELFFLREKVQKENEKIADCEKIGLKLVQKCTNVKIELDYLSRQYEKLKDDFLNLKSAISKTDNSRSLSRSNERRDLIKDSFDIKLKNSVTPNDRSTSPIPNQSSKISKTISSKRLEVTPLRKILTVDQPRSKLKISSSLQSKRK